LPDGSYHGAVWASLVPEALGAPIAFAIRARVVLLRDIGPALSPFNAFQLIQGLETLHLRFCKHQENATKLANYLKDKKEIETVIYPGLFSGEDGALVGIELKGGVDAGRKFIDKLKLVYHVANIGDARTLAIHPASTTHSQLSAAEQLKAGVTPGYVRLSVGIEHIDDIITDIDQALSNL
jgi:O-acetylhomoserine (thiol)-lyase